MDSQQKQLFDAHGFLPNGGYDEVDSRDRKYEIIYGGPNVVNKVQRPKEQITVYDQFSNQDTYMACTRFALRHINNGQNILEHGPHFQQVNPRVDWLVYLQDYPDAKTKGSSKQSAMKQAVADGWIEGFAACTSIDDCKDAIDRGKFIYTGSNNGDRVHTLQTLEYRTQDKSVVGHIFALVGYDSTGFIALNSVKKDKAYFHIGYELFGTLYSKHAICDKDDHILSFKERQKKLAKYERVINAVSELRNETDNQFERDGLHQVNETLRENKKIYYP